MILLLLWAFSGVVLGYEAARHGIVQIVVPALYLVVMFFWALVGLVLAGRAARPRDRRTPSPQEVRDAYSRMSREQRVQSPPKEGQP